MNLIQISELIAERAGRQFDKAFKKEIQDMVVYHRAAYMTDSLSRDPSSKIYFMQSFLVDLEPVSKEECEEMASCGCEDVQRTVKKIPPTLLISTHPFDYAGSPGGYQSFGWTTFGSERFLSKGPVTGKRERHTLLNEYVYVFNNKNLKQLRLEGLFSDPRRLKEFKCVNSDEPCYSESKDFPIDDRTLKIVVDAILRTELRIPIEEKIEVKADSNV